MGRGRVLGALFVIALTTSASRAVGGASGDATSSPGGLAGLWGAERTFGPAVAGTLLLDTRGARWHADIAGRTVIVAHDHGRLHFELPGGEGSFRARLDPAHHEITGQWIQPPGLVSANAYATPVLMSAVEPGVWRGRVEPLPDRLSLYLSVTRRADAALEASFRNPEFNFGRDDPYLVTVKGDQLILTSEKRGSDVLRARYDSADDVLVLDLAPLGMPLVLARRDRTHARGFYPVTPETDRWVYRPPVPTDDGWTTASLDEVGLRPAPLARLVERIRHQRYEGFRTPYIHSLLVARHGKLALEEYFYGHDRDRTHDMRSASKTFTGTMVGIALAHGAGFGLDTPVVSLFPQYPDLRHLDARKRAMTVEDLLTMTSGLDCDDNDEATPGNEDVMQSQSEADWYRYTLDLPMAREPGADSAVYCTAGVNLLGGVLRGRIDEPLPEYFFDHYARPLDILRYHVNLMPTGAAYMGGGIHMRPRDQLKLGQLYLDGGEWHERRVVPASWVRSSLAVHARFGPDHHYGFTWHLIDLTSGGSRYRVYEAGGNGGQFVLMVPEFDLVVGFTAGNYGDYGTWYRFMTELVPKYVIPAAEPPRD